MRFGKSLEQNDISVRTHVVQCSRVRDAALLRKIGGEIAIGFVEDDQHMLGNFCYEAVDFISSRKSARGIVRIGDENDSRVSVDRIGNGVEIVGIVARGNFDELALCNLSSQFV